MENKEQKSARSSYRKGEYETPIESGSHDYLSNSLRKLPNNNADLEKQDTLRIQSQNDENDGSSKYTLYRNAFKGLHANTNDSVFFANDGFRTDIDFSTAVKSNYYSALIEHDIENNSPKASPKAGIVPLTVVDSIAAPDTTPTTLGRMSSVKVCHLKDFDHFYSGETSRRWSENGN